MAASNRLTGDDASQLQSDLEVPNAFAQFTPSQVAKAYGVSFVIDPPGHGQDGARPIARILIRSISMECITDAADLPFLDIEASKL